MRRRAAKVDNGHAEIVTALREAGCSVQSLAAVGLGCPDLLVGYQRRNYLLEVKAPLGPRGGESDSGQHLTFGQVEWLKNWQGVAFLVRTPQEALEAVGAVP